MGIFKLTKGELKKIFLKPGIFVITAILVLVLTISAFIFNVNSREDNLVNIEGSTIAQMYDKSFGSSKNFESLSKLNLDKKMESSQTIIEFYKNELLNEENSKKNELYALNEKLRDDIASLLSKVNNSQENEYTQAKEVLRNAIKQDLMDINSAFLSYAQGDDGFYYLLITNKDKDAFDVFMANSLTQPFGSNTTFSATLNKIEELNVYNRIKKFIDNLLVFLPTLESIEKCEENLNSAKVNLLEIEGQIENLVNEFGTDNSLDKKNELRYLITRYQQASHNIYELTQSTLNSSALNNFSDDTIQSLYQFANSDLKTKYALEEQRLISQFYLDNNKYAFEYANPLSLTTASNVEPNVYDFMYFALELCSFIIIVYIVFLGATMIAGEYANGTMKLLAIRPYSRNKILFSKLLATVLVGIIFLIMTFIVTFITGGILFGLDSLSMLLIFNATTISSVSPIVSIIFLFLAKTIEIIFYAVLALCISTLFKSNSGSIVVAILIYFVSFVLSMFTANLGIFKFLPFVNTNLFGYFGSHSLAKTGNLIADMFSKVVANDMNFYISFAILTVFSVILYTITAIVFNKRDINK